MNSIVPDDPNALPMSFRSDINSIHVGETGHHHEKNADDLRFTVRCSECYPHLIKAKYNDICSGNPEDPRIETAKEKELKDAAEKRAQSEATLSLQQATAYLAHIAQNSTSQNEIVELRAQVASLAKALLDREQ